MALPYAKGNTSLYIPGFGDQPLSVTNIGENNAGQTTWQVVGGTPTGTFQSAAFAGTATLIEGPHAVFVTAHAPSGIGIAVLCSILNGIATCTEVVDGKTTIVIELVTVIVVQGGGTAPVQPATSILSSPATATVTVTAIATSSSQPSSSPQITSSIAPSTTNSQSQSASAASTTAAPTPTQDNVGTTIVPSASLIPAISGAKGRQDSGLETAVAIIAVFASLVIAA